MTTITELLDRSWVTPPL